MGGHPIFSVTTPIFNGKDFVNRCYALLTMQTCTDWEWVVVDDGSTDETADLVKQIDDKRVRLITYKPNRGRGYARSRALEESCGEWMVVWDVDDLYFPDRLAKINQARLEGYDYFCSYAVVVDNALQIKGVRGFHPASGGLPRYFVHPTLACRIELARCIGYDSSLRAGEDATIVLTLGKNYKGQFYEDALTIYQQEREVNLSKACASNKSQFLQIQRMYQNGLLKMGFGTYILMQMKWRIKLLILNFMRLTPSLYLQTLKTRSDGEIKQNYALPLERLAFIDSIRRIDFGSSKSLD